MCTSHAIQGRLRSYFTVEYTLQLAVALVFEAVQHIAGSASPPLASMNWTARREVFNSLQCKLVLIFSGKLLALKKTIKNNINQHHRYWCSYNGTASQPGEGCKKQKTEHLLTNVGCTWKSWELHSRLMWQLMSPMSTHKHFVVAAMQLCGGTQLLSPKGRPYHHSVEVFTWEGHTKEECVVRIIHTQGHTFHTDTIIIIHLPSGMWTSKLYNQRRGAQQASKEKSWTSLMIQPCSSNCTHKTACEKPPQLCWLHRGSWVHEWSGLHPSMSARLWSAESANWVGL